MTRQEGKGLLEMMRRLKDPKAIFESLVVGDKYVRNKYVRKRKEIGKAPIFTSSEANRSD